MLDKVIDKAGGVLTEAYGDVVKPVLKPIGEVLGFLPRSIKCLLQGWEKWIINGEESIRLTSEAIRKKIEATPAERLTEPEPYVVVPAIQQLGYSHSSEELRELYANLIVSSMDVEKKGLVHPAFVDILKKLTPDEANIIQYFKGRDFIEYLDLRAYIKEEEGGGFRTIADHKTLLSDEVNFFMPDNELAYLQNLVCLGILKDCEGTFTVIEDNYKLIENKLGLESLRNQYVPEQFSSIRSEKSFYQVTDFGRNFINTVTE